VIRKPSINVGVVVGIISGSAHRADLVGEPANPGAGWRFQRGSRLERDRRDNEEGVVCQLRIRRAKRRNQVGLQCRAGSEPAQRRLAYVLWGETVR
jgi:hypothetical protein